MNLIGLWTENRKKAQSMENINGIIVSGKIYIPVECGNDLPCGVANILIQGVLERIFGKDFFKEDKV